jgi:hypothetical protein
MSGTGGNPKSGCGCDVGGTRRETCGVPIVLALLFLAGLLRNVRGARAINRS